MKDIDLEKFQNVSFGKNVKIKSNSAVIKNGAKIGDNVTIESQRIEIGFDTIIEEGTFVKSIHGDMTDFLIGDNCLIGSNNRFLLPYFSMKDYSQLYNSCLCSGYKPLTIGYNCWIGQGAILNSFENLIIGNNVRMGGSQIWTHVASGELLEGSNFYSAKPVVIKDDVWLMGFGHLISPGVTIAEKSVIMAGSVVTKDTKPMRTYSGIPAVDISEKLPAWKSMTLKDKIELIKQFIKDFQDNFLSFAKNIHFLEETDKDKKIMELNQLYEPQVLVVDQIELSLYQNTKLSIFDLSTKRYLKRRTPIEIAWIRSNNGYKARFIPWEA